MLLIVLLFVAATNATFINVYPRFTRYYDDGDPGDPLILTPLIKDGKIEEAQKKASVTNPPFDKLQSYAGYLTVDEKYNSNLFFWYFPSKSDPNHDPLMLWLQGGPGASSLFGLFFENGPYTLSEDGIGLRNYSWHTNHNLIYIDNPVGSGYSFTEDDSGYVVNEKQVGKQLYEAVRQLFLIFPQFETLHLYIAGESYAGKYVPALAFKIHKTQEKFNRQGKENPNPMQLKGIAIGNGLSDPLHQLNYGDYLYQLGLIDINDRDEFHKYEKRAITCIKDHHLDCAYDTFEQIISVGHRSSGSLCHNCTGFNSFYNYLKPEGDDLGNGLGAFVQTTEFRRSVHVGNKTFHDADDANKVEMYLKKDVMDTVAPWIAELLSFYRVCVYSGQLDLLVGYPLTLGYLQRLKYKNSAAYKTSPRNVWKVEGEFAGYVKEAGNLIEILVRNAGHMAAADQSKWIFDMISRFTRNKSFA